MESADFRVRLASEVEKWQRDGLITPQQSEDILARYHTDGAAQTFRLGPLATFLTIAGSMVLGLGVILAFGLLDAFAWLGWEMGKNYHSAPQSFGISLVFELAGVLVYAASRWQQPKGIEAVYQVLGLLAILSFSYVLSFGAFWQAAEGQNIASIHPPLWFWIAVVEA